ncbi:hypothetical protein LY78DRAFT_468552 [Colletotrichum sublineola]|nr:hypothetical protein LY78DRAFT_468552 [Colletotrichum sublineola]
MDEWMNGYNVHYLDRYLRSVYRRSQEKMAFLALLSLSYLQYITALGGRRRNEERKHTAAADLTRRVGYIVIVVLFGCLFTMHLITRLRLMYLPKAGRASCKQGMDQ